MMDMMDMKSIGIERIAWDIIWRAKNQGYDLVNFINIIKPLLIDNMDPVYYKVMIHAINNDYDMEHFFDSWSLNQITSKEWLVDSLTPFLTDLGPVNIQIFGGWFGYPLADMLMEKINVAFIENIDLDPKAIKLFRYFNDLKELNEETTPRLIPTISDVMISNKREFSADVVINTSSEHMPNLIDIIKGRKYRDSKHRLIRLPDHVNNGCIFALQSNNMFHIEDHINCVNNEDELVEKSGFIDVRYKGSMTMPNGYTRFMAIGYV